jgi:hypothetical protein
LTKLSTTYFGPVQWYQKLYRSDCVWIEACETFQKQTYRNRCIIATTNGPQTLSVPIEHAAANQPISTIRISNHGKWRTEHWNALQSAYGESPFFDYYADDIRPFFEQRWERLLDFNEAIRQKMCELLDIQPEVSYSEKFELSAINPPKDFREAIRPKHPQTDPDFVPKPYYQVYQQRHGFLPNLSVLDLLFNMGPESIFWL